MRSPRMFAFVSVAVAALASAAQARPARVVVLDFDGPRALADLGKSTILSVLGDDYDVVATRRWESARAQAPGHGPEQWRTAARKAGVDAVIEGWIDDEGRHHVLTIAVHDASTGNEVDSISVKLGDHGTTPEVNRQLAAQLDDIMGWIEGDSVDADPSERLPELHVGHAKHARRDVRRADDRDGDRDPAPAAAPHAQVADGAAPTDDDRADEQPDDPPARPDTHAADRTGAPRRLALADTETAALDQVLAPSRAEAALVTDQQPPHVPHPTPRFRIQAGGYLASRGMSFDTAPVANAMAPAYPASPVQGIGVAAAVYPMPSQKTDGPLQGIGFTLSVEHSLGAMLAAQDSTGYGQFTINQSAYEAGVHYRWQLHPLIALDADVSYGNVTHTIEDLPTSIQIPDTSYSYLGAGGSIELAVTDRASVGFGAHYLAVLDAGDITSEDWYGSGNASGLQLDGDFVIPLTRGLYVQGALEYRRFETDFAGTGVLASMQVQDIVDSSIGGRAALGVQF